MYTRALVLLLALSVSVTLGGCASPPDADPEGAPAAKSEAAEAATTLSKATLPTEVGTRWTTVRSDGTDVPLDFTVDGPWTLEAGEGWSESPSEIVEPASVPGIEQFEDVTYVTKSSAADSPDYYYPRRVTDEWVQGLGRIVVDGDTVTPEPAEVSNFWPLDLEVGREYEVAETEQYTTVATVLARNTATVPAGTIENAYLVRFRSTLATSGTIIDNYYLMAGGVGMVAWLSDLTGSEDGGFTSVKNIVLLSSLPAK